MEGFYYEEAISHFKAALALESDAWLPKEGLARIYGDQENYSDAIRLMEEAYNSLPEKFDFLGGFLLPYIAEWKRIIGDDEGAYETAQQGYRAEPSSHLAQDRYLRALDQRCDSSSFIQVLNYMYEDTWNDTGRSLFVRFLSYGYDVFAETGRAFRAEGRPRFIIEAMEQSMSVILASKDPYMKIWIQGEFGTFQYQYNDDVDAAMKLWEQALKTLAGAPATLQKENGKWARDRYGNLLARLCFDAAVSARKDGTNPWPYTKRLKQLATVTSTTDEDFADFFDFFGPGYASMLWGCWLRTYERAEESIWRKTFKVRILDELNTLDDEDPSNDMAGLHSLAITLLHLGDDEAAGAILAILFMPLKVVRDTAAENTKDDGDGNDLEKESTNEGAKQGVDGYKRDEESSHEHDWEEIKAEDHGSDIGSSSPDEGKNDSTAAHNLLPDVQEQEEAHEPNPPSDTTTSESVHPPALVRRPTDHISAITINGTTRLALSLDIAWIHECNGPCDTSYADYASLYICKFCLGTKFCRECLQLVKEEKLVCHDCSPQHSWYQAWPIPEGKAELVAEEKKEEGEGGRWVIRKEWLDRLRGEWL